MWFDISGSVQCTITRLRLHGAGIYMRFGAPRWICWEVSAPVGVRRLMSSLGMHFKRALEGRHSQDRKSKQKPQNNNKHSQKAVKVKSWCRHVVYEHDNSLHNSGGCLPIRKWPNSVHLAPSQKKLVLPEVMLPDHSFYDGEKALLKH